ncbi:MAG: D-glycero-beta-D-manno-heptose-7-phosphate kinase [Fidelibacterota bacterium]
MEQKRFQDIISSFAEQKVLVLGDVMLDSYLWGTANRISPEAPVPVVDIQRRSHNPGGAGNVALNLRSLGSLVTVASVVGQDEAGRQLLKKFNDLKIGADLIVIDESRPTTVKSRVIAQGQQVVRVDEESRELFSDETYGKLKKIITDHIPDYDALILEDYNKGLFTTHLIEFIIQLCRQHSIPVYVDPKMENISSFRKVRLFKPNLHEFRHCTRAYPDPGDMAANARKLKQELQAELLMITRGEDGILMCTDEEIFTVPTRARRVHDVSGAGDSVISTFVLADLAGATPREACQLANYAAGIVCEEVGVVPITIEKLSEIIDYHNPI